MQAVFFQWVALFPFLTLISARVLLACKKQIYSSKRVQNSFVFLYSDLSCKVSPTCWLSLLGNAFLELLDIPLEVEDDCIWRGEGLRLRCSCCETPESGSKSRLNGSGEPDCHKTTLGLLPLPDLSGNHLSFPQPCLKDLPLRGDLMEMLGESFVKDVVPAGEHKNQNKKLSKSGHSTC